MKKICPGCKKEFILEELSASAKSVRHVHNTAHKSQKRIVAHVSFRNVNEHGHIQIDPPALVCNKCKQAVLNGMVNGGMWE